METMPIRPIRPTHRFLVRDAHHPKSIRGMTCPVVLGTEIDETLPISLGVISAERVNARLRRHLIEPNAREEPARRLDTLGSRSAALVRHDCVSKPARCSSLSYETACTLSCAAPSCGSTISASSYLFLRSHWTCVASGCPCAS